MVIMLVVVCMYERDAETTGTSYLLAYGRRCGLKQSISSFSVLLPPATRWCAEQVSVSRLLGMLELEPSQGAAH